MNGVHSGGRANWLVGNQQSCGVVNNINQQNNHSVATPEEIYEKAKNLKEGFSGVGKLPEVLKLFEQAAYKGCTKAYYDAGIMHYYGQGTEPNRLHAKECFLRAMDKEPRALHMLGMYYQSLAKEESNRALTIYDLPMVEFGDPEVLCGLIGHGSDYHIHYQGNSGASSIAIGYFKKAADKGDAKSAHQLGKIYRGDNKHDQAVKWFEKAHELGDKDSDAMFYCGQVYYKGLGVTVDFQKARAFFQKAETLGHSEASEYVVESTLNGTEKIQIISEDRGNQINQYEMKEPV